MSNFEIIISLIIPTRHRINLLKNCIDSFYNLSMHPKHIEFIILVDDDEDTLNFLLKEKHKEEINITTIVRKRGETLVDHYDNYGAKCSNGRLLWILNDECECKTNNWDHKLFGIYEHFIKKEPDKIFYIFVDDDTHSKSGKQKEQGCCFPVLTKEAVETLGWLMPPSIEWQGADVALWRIYLFLHEKFEVNRIIMAEKEIKILHHSTNNGTNKMDDVQSRAFEISKTTGLSVFEIGYCASVIFDKIALKSHEFAQKCIWESEFKFKQYLLEQENKIINEQNKSL